MSDSLEKVFKVNLLSFFLEIQAQIRSKVYNFFANKNGFLNRLFFFFLQTKQKKSLRNERKKIGFYSSIKRNPLFWSWLVFFRCSSTIILHSKKSLFEWFECGPFLLKTCLHLFAFIHHRVLMTHFFHVYTMFLLKRERLGWLIEQQAKFKKTYTQKRIVFEQ